MTGLGALEQRDEHLLGSQYGGAFRVRVQASLESRASQSVETALPCQSCQGLQYSLTKGTRKTCNMDSLAAGNGDCDDGLMCFFGDVEIKQGVCVPLCDGSANAPLCLSDSKRCVIDNDGFLPICVDVCDPLTQEPCDTGYSCYAVDSVCSGCFPMVEGRDGHLCLSVGDRGRIRGEGSVWSRSANM